MRRGTAVKKQGKEKAAKRISISMTQQQADDLDLLVGHTRVRLSVYLRDAVDLLLEKHADEVREAKKKKDRK
jgi:Arc/MetJ-type ribon-helix-helix transcriptional regulator